MARLTFFRGMLAGFLCSSSGVMFGFGVVIPGIITLAIGFILVYMYGFKDVG